MGDRGSRESSIGSDSDDDEGSHSIKRSGSKVTGGSSEVDKTSLRRKSTLKTNISAGSRSNLKSAAGKSRGG